MEIKFLDVELFIFYLLDKNQSDFRRFKLKSCKYSLVEQTNIKKLLHILIYLIQHRNELGRGKPPIGTVLLEALIPLLDCVLVVARVRLQELEVLLTETLLALNAAHAASPKVTPKAPENSLSGG